MSERANNTSTAPRPPYSLQETCERLGGRSPATVYRMLNAGILRGFKIGARRVFDPDVVDHVARNGCDVPKAAA
tara:strand:- start:25 stop:246 length:222 start_codon:yes stop_codon:yes gene_type:complete